VIVAVIFKLVRMSELGRLISDVILMKVPVMGQIIQKSSIARFTRTLGTLVAAGVPILEADRDYEGDQR
jgi:type IV pilus assembly protein PilC